MQDAGGSIEVKEQSLLPLRRSVLNSSKLKLKPISSNRWLNRTRASMERLKRQLLGVEIPASSDLVVDRQMKIYPEGEMSHCYRISPLIEDLCKKGSDGSIPFRPPAILKPTIHRSL
jgi:hypothetical protein